MANGGIGLWIGWYPSNMVTKVTRIQGAPFNSVTAECKMIGHSRSTHACGLSKFIEVLYNYGLWSHVWNNQWFFNFFQKCGCKK